MKNSSIKKINTAGLVGYIISIILIVLTIVGMVAIGICTLGAFAISDNEINVKISTNIDISSTGNFFNKLNSFISIDGTNDLNTLIKDGSIEDTKDNSEINIKEENGGLSIDAKTREITINMKMIIATLITGFIFLLAVTILLYMVKALMKSLKQCETPFSEEVINNMTKFAYSLIGVVILKTVLGGFMSLLSSDSKFNLSIDLGSVLLVAVIYILITVFKYGAKLQQESDETI